MMYLKTLDTIRLALHYMIKGIPCLPFPEREFTNLFFPKIFLFGCLEAFGILV